ncbi:putative Flavin-containing monooxygenase FMO GS-OX-like 2 [Hypsibius exemplaris]|uniref:Flavin-containing monooxygenase n=1 Tax=Hypsibius exemplaris TaxID=2072580 RepID=A0A9X6NKQ2_HYPEX|nr:putative Flavin-containing monooxygenase FMO GS-OX-like 2 [Hypsibius exemplaris]
MQIIFYKCHSGDAKYEVVLFEQANRIGGVWNYPAGCEENLEKDPASPFYSRMYKNMRTNLPTDLMCLEGFPFPQGSRSYCDVQTVNNYLEGYAKHFHLSEHIKLSHRIVNIAPQIGDKENTRVAAIGPRWTVTYEDLQQSSETSEIFDAVLICTGKYHSPYIPEISGLKHYRGPILHSSEYRDPEQFRTKTVLVIGGGPSATDITTDMATTAQQIIVAKRKIGSLFHNNQLPNVLETTMPKTFNEKEVVLEDGFVPCLSTRMAFPLLVALVPITPLLDCQVKYFKAILDGQVQLPSTDDMLLYNASDYHRRTSDPKGSPRQVAHGLPEEAAWAYLNELGKEAGFDPYDPVVPQLTKAAFEAIFSGNPAYKEHLLHRIDANSFKHIKATA